MRYIYFMKFPCPLNGSNHLHTESEFVYTSTNEIFILTFGWKLLTEKKTFFCTDRGPFMRKIL